MKKALIIGLLALFLIRTGHSQVIFTYKTVQVLKSSELLDTTILWTNAKVKSTYDLPGSLTHNKKKDYIKIRRSEDDSYQEINFIFKHHHNTYEFISGKKLYLFEDPLYGPSAGLWINKGGKWLIFRKASISQMEKASQSSMDQVQKGN